MAGALSIGEREALFSWLAEDRLVSWSVLAARLGRHRTTVAREVARNGGRLGYSPFRAQQRAGRMLCRPRVSKLEADPVLAARVVSDLEAGFSPQGVSKRLARRGVRVSHETIYRAVYSGVLGVDPQQVLRRRRKARYHRHQVFTTNISGNYLSDYRRITTRPAVVTSRVEPGHWEGDLIVGRAAGSAMITLYELTSRYTHLIELAQGRKTRHVVAALAQWLQTLPAGMRRTLTWDQGAEMTRWPDIDHHLTQGIYFTDRRSPWQRAGNEQNNGLIRFWLPRTIDLTKPGPRLHQALHVLNNQPRRSLQWQTPNEVYAHHIRAMTG